MQAGKQSGEMQAGKPSGEHAGRKSKAGKCKQIGISRKTKGRTFCNGKVVCGGEKSGF